MTHRITLINPKGGCGKSTISTNIASWYVNHGRRCALLDRDSQASCTHWAQKRQSVAGGVPVIAAHQNARAGVTRAWQMRVPDGTERVIVDTPAGLPKQELPRLVSEAGTILIPVLPSPVDIHAVSRFIEDLLLIGHARSQGTRLGVVANRVRVNTLVFRALRRFLNRLNIPFVSVLRETQFYARAAGEGLGIHELPGTRTAQDREVWESLMLWIEEGIQQDTVCSASVTPLRPGGLAGS